MDKRLDMSKAERKKLQAMEMLMQGKAKVGEMAHFLGITPRQVRRLKTRYKQAGHKGLLHGNRGRSPVNKLPDEKVEQIKNLHNTIYWDHGPTLFAEQLERREKIKISAESARRILNRANLNKKRRRHKGHRQRRQRREHLGELVQLDGSFHRWYGNQGEYYCMMVMIDDATSITMSMMFEQETTVAALTLLKAWIEKYGVPRAIYSDRKTVYFAGREPTLEEELKGIVPRSDYGMACDDLGIELIPAYSPQAKGRVERRHGTHQDRFVKEFRLEGVVDNETANRHLQSKGDAWLNGLFSVPSANPVDFHRRAPSAEKLTSILCQRSERKIGNDWVVRDSNEFFQITKDNRPLPRPHASVTVKRRLDGQVIIEYKDRGLNYRRLASKAGIREPERVPGFAPGFGGSATGSADSALRYTAKTREIPPGGM